ncbi:MAG: alcohol dehydrogenase [Planctomycetota bacterium]|nr:MAG: alcohol dehydrogenase [Planctomycetota bacterium]
MVFEGPGQELVDREFALPTLGAGELLVEVTCTTLCGSDLHTHSGRRETRCPTILGHEILGRVAELRPGDPPVDLNGSPLAVGDRITWSVAASCGSCFYCQHGLPQKCEQLFKYGHERLGERHPLSGGLAEHCHLARGTSILKVPDELPDEVACPVNCATATVAGALRVAGQLTDRNVLVQGAGMLGLTAAAMASHRGAREVIVCDPDEERLQWASRFGATRSVHLEPGSRRLTDTVARVTSARGVDVALELSGDPASIEAGLQLLRTGGRYVLVGSVFPSREVALPPELVVRRLLRIEGIHNYTPTDLVAALDFLTAAHEEFPLAELVVARFPLREAEAAFQHAEATRAPRVAVVPGE